MVARMSPAMNQLARAVYAPVLADPRAANTARFVYLKCENAEQFFVDYDQISRDAAAMLRLEAGQNPHDEDLIALVGELSTRSELFRKQWRPRMYASTDPAENGCGTPPLVSWISTSRRWRFPMTPACSSTSTPRPRIRPLPMVSGCWLRGRPARTTSPPNGPRSEAETLQRAGAADSPALTARVSASPRISVSPANSPSSASSVTTAGSVF
jgi:hypothetical protein